MKLVSVKKNFALASMIFSPFAISCSHSTPASRTASPSDEDIAGAAITIWTANLKPGADRKQCLESAKKVFSGVELLNSDRIKLTTNNTSPKLLEDFKEQGCISSFKLYSQETIEEEENHKKVTSDDADDFSGAVISVYNGVLPAEGFTASCEKRAKELKLKVVQILPSIVTLEAVNSDTAPLKKLVEEKCITDFEENGEASALGL